jgi:hypothetical protein
MARVGESWWTLSLLVALPAPALTAAAGALGPGSAAGIACAVLATGWLALHLAVLQPALDRRAGPRESLGRVVRSFLRRSLAMRTVADVAVEAQSAAERILRIDRTLLIVGGPNGQLSVLGGEGGEAARIGDAERAFRSLARDGEPVDRASLAEVSSIGVRAVQELLEALSADAVAPLCHRGLLVGCLVFGAPRQPIDRLDKRARLRSLASHATVGLVGALLEGESKAGPRPSRELSTALLEAMRPGEGAARACGFDLAGVSRPSPDCGGDFWLAEDLGARKLLLVIGDASGHGPAAAMLAAIARGAVLAAREARGAATTPADVLHAMHRTVARAGGVATAGPRMSALACVFDGETRQVTIGSAGHVPAHLLSRAPLPVSVEAIDLGGPALGSPGDLDFPTATRSLAGDACLVLASDGLIEAGAPSAVPFGRRRFAGLVEALAGRHAPTLPEAILDEVDRYLVGRRVADDITVIAIEPHLVEAKA